MPNGQYPSLGICFAVCFPSPSPIPITVTPSVTPEGTPEPSVTPEPTPTIPCVNTDCLCYEYTHNSLEACSITYFTCNGIQTTFTIPGEDNGLDFKLCVENNLTAGIVSDSCGFVQVSPTCGCKCSNQSCDECEESGGGGGL